MWTKITIKPTFPKSNTTMEVRTPLLDLYVCVREFSMVAIISSIKRNCN